MRIAITGPESSGKTTIALALAEQLNGTCVVEFAREYLLKLNREYNQQDLDLIAKGQVKSWDASAENSIIVSDTEMLVMHVWSEVKFKTTSDYILKALGKQRFHHYFLCAPDIPWEEDPLREHPEMREELFNLYLEKLEELEVPFTILKGDNEMRMKTAMEVLGELGFL